MPEEKPYRIQTSAGHRRYLCSGMYLPSVTTVLSATESEKSRKSLQQWIDKNPGASEEACTRGTAIHLCCENYLRGLPVNCPEPYVNYWRGMDRYLDYFDDLFWSERPLRPDWNFLRSDDKEVAYVWSTEHKFAGCPDLIGTIGGLNVICDFKTSSGRYQNCFPDRGDREGFGGYRKYIKCAQQQAAYALALKERTGFEVDVALILATTEEHTQAIFIDNDQLKLAESRFIKRAQQFHSMFPSDETVD